VFAQTNKTLHRQMLKHESLFVFVSRQHNILSKKKETTPRYQTALKAVSFTHCTQTPSLFKPMSLMNLI
jgi:hypothetical protein